MIYVFFYSIHCNIELFYLIIYCVKKTIWFIGCLTRKLFDCAVVVGEAVNIDMRIVDEVSR